MNDMESKDMIQLKVFYDGLCELCSREIAHYQRQKGSEYIEFIDIFSASFQADDYGLDPKAVHKNLHAITPEGKVLVGVDTFVAIWKILPRYQFAAKIASRTFISKVGKNFYALFTLIRPYLPRKKHDQCSSSPYCDL